MNPKVRNNFAVVAVGALACSLSFAPVAMAAPDAPVNPTLPGAAGDAFRVAGQSRFGTAVAASQVLKAADRGNTVILSNYLSWSDVLAATPLADELNAPVLYTYDNRLAPETIAELKRIQLEDGAGLTKITLVGGELAINKSVVKELKDLGFTMVDRVGGQSRYDTAMLLAAETVDYYEAAGVPANLTVAPARANIAAAIQAEEAFAAAYAELGVAQAKFVEAIKADNTAVAVVTSAQAALAAITNGLVPSAPVANVTVNPAREAPLFVPATANTAVTVTSVTEFNSVLASYKFRAANSEAVSAFVNLRAAEFVANGGVQTANWSVLEDAVAPAGKLFTIPLKEGDATGTIQQLTDALTTLGYFTGDPSGVPVADVLTRVTDVKDATASYLVKVQVQYDAYLEATLTGIAANSANSALQPQINAASAKLKAAKDARVITLAAKLKAEAASDAAFVAFNSAVLPNPAVKLAAQTTYDAALKAALMDGTLYPAFLATGLDFPDALAAGPAAAKSKGVVLLTNGAKMAPATQQYLDSKAAAITVGGPAAAAYPKAAKSFVGESRYETATKLAAAYFSTVVDSKYVGLASGEVAADAVVGGALLANLDGTIVLTRQNLLPAATSSYLSYTVSNIDPQLLVLGGKLAISNDVRDDAVDALKD